MFVTHPFDPVFDTRSRVLVLGTMASKASRDSGFYYGHPRNRFWPVLAALFNASVPESIDDKKALLLQNGVALWDVLRTCDIDASSDASIQNPCANDFTTLFSALPNLRVFANGQTATALYRKHVYQDTGISIIPLPSTSPANAAWTLVRLTEAWEKIKTV